MEASDSQIILTRRIAVYGGTFDPLHNGHLQVACAITEAFALNQLQLVPAAIPPHKRGVAICSPYHRMAMLALATAELPRITVSPLELETPERPYTIETLGRLQQLDPQSRIFFVMGADSFRDITSWREYRRILTEYDVIVAVRPGYLADEISTSGMIAHLPPELHPRVIDLRGRLLPSISQLTNRHIYLTDYVNVAISATEVRQAAAQGQSLAGIVPPPVADYIAKYKLYQYPQ